MLWTNARRNILASRTVVIVVVVVVVIVVVRTGYMVDTFRL